MSQTTDITGGVEPRVPVKNRKKKIILIILLSLVILFLIPIPFISDRQAISIQENALLFLYNSEDYGKKKNVDVFYVDIGKGQLFAPFMDWDSNGFVLISEDPSAQLLDRLTESSSKMKPFSYFQDADPNDIVVLNKQGQRGVILSVGPIIKSMTIARCRTAYYGGGLCSSEYETFLIWTPLGWKHLYSLRLWGS